MAENYDGRIEQDSNDWEAFRRAVAAIYALENPEYAAMTPAERLEHMLSTGATTRPVLSHRESFQTACEKIDSNEATTVDADESVGAATPGELMSNNSVRNLSGPSVKDAENEALPGNTNQDVARDVTAAAGPSTRAQAAHLQQQHASQPGESQDVEQWLEAMRTALTEPYEGVRRLRTMAAALREDQSQVQSESDAISRFIAALPVPPDNSTALSSPLERLSMAIAGSVPEPETGNLTQVRPKRQARIFDLRAAAEACQPQVRTDSATPFAAVLSNGAPSSSNSSSKPQGAEVVAQQDVSAGSAHDVATNGVMREPTNAAAAATPMRRMTEAEYRKELGKGKAKATGDVYSRLAAPTSAWKAKQKRPQSTYMSRPPFTPDTEVVRPSTAFSVAESVERSDAGRSNRSRSSSMGTVNENDAAPSRNNVDDLMKKLRSQPVPARSPKRQDGFNREQDPVREQPQVLTAAVLAPIAVRPARQASCRLRGHDRTRQMWPHHGILAPALSGSGTRFKQRAATTARYARPNPFAPKPETNPRANARPRQISRSRSSSVLKSVAKASQSSESTARAVERQLHAHATVWERLAQQSTSSSGAKDKRQSVCVRGKERPDEDHDAELQDAIDESDMAIRTQAAIPPRQHMPALNGNEARPVSCVGNHRQDSLALNSRPSAQQIDGERSLDQQPEVPVITPGAPALSTELQHKPESIWSSSGIVFTSRNGANGNRPDPTPKDVMPTPAELQEMVARAEIEVNSRHASQDLSRKTIVVPERPKKDSVLKSSVKNAMSAIKRVPFKVNGMKDSALAGIKEYARPSRRRSLDSLMERPDIAALQDSSNTCGIGQQLLVGRPYESMRLNHDAGPSRRVLQKPFHKRFFRRSAQPVVPSTLAPHPEEEEASVRPEPAPLPVSAPEAVELPATDADGNVQRRSADTIRVWNDGGATWLHARDFVDDADPQQS